ncbi:uncharacterized protein LOC109140675 isoform X2 [Xyrichtys novacula]|uniref:Uncharacterized protein LOC109140675 isoform X2 n=1 Tax=Xyrichtys novacula TaxID=13765 RepID=A0AAV1HNP2_XYRNO|nr:uncharacterized protein LOC109140675 isoform X2 [Xyrichtys novacula]
MNLTVVTASLLCSLGWVSVSVSESQTVEVQSGEDVTLLCSNFSSSYTQIIWFRVISKSQPKCISHMFKSFEPATFCSGFQHGKFETTSNISTIFLSIKQVELSDSGLYFCGFIFDKGSVIVSSTYLEVRELVEMTKLTSVILVVLVVVLVMIIICLSVQIKKLQRAHIGEQNPQQYINPGSDDLNYASVTFRQRTARSHEGALEGEMETTTIYSATR